MSARPASSAAGIRFRIRLCFIRSPSVAGQSLSVMLEYYGIVETRSTVWWVLLEREPVVAGYSAEITRPGSRLYCYCRTTRTQAAVTHAKEGREVHVPQ